MTPVKKETQLHFVGIGGIGMSGIAEVFLNQGYRVSGSDASDSETVRRLIGLGARIAIGHRAENISGASVVVVSSAIRPDNPEVVEARKLRIPVIPRAEMLGELMRGKTGIAIAGSHGKTTTTSMLATILTVAEMDPTLVIGGKVDSLGGNAKLGQGRFVVAEADESDGSFLHLPATYAAITNIDNDHLDYFKSLEAIEDAFVDFVAKIPFYGAVAVCLDDPGIRRCLGRLTKPYMTYGTAPDADFRVTNLVISPRGSEFEVSGIGKLALNVPGKHNVLNATAAAALATKIGVPARTIAEGLKAFGGVKRRFEVRWRDPDGQRIIIDDYGHHPTEIEATLSAARSYWPGRIVTVFQPHRFSRTLHCREGFLTAFRQSDIVLITDIYAAGEDPIEGVSAAALVGQIRALAKPGQEVTHVGDLSTARKAVLGKIADGDMILCLGAGSITRLAEELKADLESRVV